MFIKNLESKGKLEMPNYYFEYCSFVIKVKT